MRNWNIGHLLAVLFLTLFAVAALAAAGNDPSWKAPASAAAKKNPLAKNPSAAKQGEDVFQRTCAACHGPHGDAGLAGASNLRSAGVQSQTDGALEWKISKGNVSKGMPSFNSLTQQKRWELVRYIRTLKGAAK